jgi:hypothetical protein
LYLLLNISYNYDKIPQMNELDRNPISLIQNAMNKLRNKCEHALVGLLPETTRDRLIEDHLFNLYRATEDARLTGIDGFRKVTIEASTNTPGIAPIAEKLEARHVEKLNADLDKTQARVVTEALSGIEDETKRTQLHITALRMAKRSLQDQLQQGLLTPEQAEFVSRRLLEIDDATIRLLYPNKYS